MGLKTVPEMGNVECANCVSPVAQDDQRPGLFPSECDEAQVSARRTGVTSLNIQGTGVNLGRRARSSSFCYQIVVRETENRQLLHFLASVRRVRGSPIAFEWRPEVGGLATFGFYGWCFTPQLGLPRDSA